MNSAYNEWDETPCLTLGGVIDSDKEYVITCKVNIDNITINVPSTGLYLSGFNFDITGIFTTLPNQTMFYSAAGGNILMKDFYITAGGAGSKVYDLIASTGFEAIEVERLNYNDCESLGTIFNYRQGLETGTGRFGGTPTLTLDGVWLGGFRIVTSIVRNLTAGTYALFEAGGTFSMNSRFGSDMNIDLPADASYFDFDGSHFPNSSTLQLENGIISRDGVFDSTDALLAPNITQGNVTSKWVNNVGLLNTKIGGIMTVTTEGTTTVSVADTEYLLDDPTFTATAIEHFTQVDNYKFTHIAQIPNEFRMTVDFTLETFAGDEVELFIYKWDFSGSSEELIYSTSRQVNNLSGGRDVAFFNFTTYVTMDDDDYVYFKVSNLANTVDITAEERRK